MKRLVLGVLILGISLSACGNTSPEPAPSTAAPTPTVEASPTSEPSFAPPKLESLIIAPGGVGPLGIGMTTAEALATGVAIEVEQDPNEGCELSPLAWIDEYGHALDVWPNADNLIVSIGVYEAGPHTESGLGVGSTLAEISNVYENAEMAEVGFEQTGLMVSDGSQWLGFLFDEHPDEVTRDSVVQFVEVTGSTKPSLMRIGC